MEENKEIEQKPISDKQEELITKMLKSRKILDDEYKIFKTILDNKVKNSYEASVLIEYLLSLVKFRRMFLSSRMKAYKKCFYCSTREEIKRYTNHYLKRDIWLCENCMLNSIDRVTFKIKDIEGFKKGSVDTDFLYERERDDKAIAEQEFKDAVIEDLNN